LTEERNIIDNMRKRANNYQVKSYFTWFIILILFIGTVYYFIKVGDNVSAVIDGSTDANITIGGGETIFDFLGGAVLRIGAVILAAYLMRSLFIVARFQQLASENLYSKADILDLSQNDIQKMRALVALSEFHKTEFERSPKNPFDGAMQLLKETVSKKEEGK
jgi:hypothetical protein